MAMALAFALPALGRNRRDTTGYEFGPDEYPPLETIGWNNNHIALNVADLDASLDFYTNVLGMRHIFTYHASDTLKFAYIGYPSGGRNGTGYQTPTELSRFRTNMQGLIEFIYIAPDASTPPPEKPSPASLRSNSFSHMGLIVPDMQAARKRFKAAGVKIIKDIGVKLAPTGPVAESFGFGLLPPGTDDWKEAAMMALQMLGANEFMFIEDPDGNVIEVQPLL